MVVNDVVTLRPYKGVDDAVALEQLGKRAAKIDDVDPLSTLDRPRSVDVIHAQAQCAQEFRVVMRQGTIVGSIRVTSWIEEDGTWVYLHDGHVDPQCRGQGIATIMVDWAETTIATLAADAMVTDRAVFAANDGSSHDRAELLTHNGYKPVFSMIEMELRDLDHLPAAKPSEELTLNVASETDVRAVWELNEVVYKGRAFRVASSGFDYDGFVSGSGNDLSLWTLARSGDRLVGFVTSRIDERRAEVTELSVHPELRRAGLGTVLLRKSLDVLRERRQRIVRLHTNGENVSGARSLYEKFGLRVVATHVRYRKSVQAGSRDQTH